MRRPDRRRWTSRSLRMRSVSVANMGAFGSEMKIERGWRRWKSAMKKMAVGTDGSQYEW